MIPKRKGRPAITQSGLGTRDFDGANVTEFRVFARTECAAAVNNFHRIDGDDPGKQSPH
jgi:hypothetical protein